MGRYSNERITIRNFNNTKENKAFYRYSTTMYRRVPLQDSDLYIITQAGDRLDNLANQFYGDSRLWWFLAQANHTNTINVEIGTRLRVPATLDFAEPF